MTQSDCGESHCSSFSINKRVSLDGSGRAQDHLLRSVCDDRPQKTYSRCKTLSKLTLQTHWGPRVTIWMSEYIHHGCFISTARERYPVKHPLTSQNLQQQWCYGSVMVTMVIYWITILCCVQREREKYIKNKLYVTLLILWYTPSEV